MDNSEQFNESYQAGTNHDFERNLIDALDLSKWTAGPNLAEIYANWERIKEAVKDEEILYRRIREEIVSKIRDTKVDLPVYGIQRFEAEDIRKAHHGLLFNGGVEAVDGTILNHDTLPLTITQIGVCLVSYQGEQGSYAHRMFRKDMAIREDSPLDDVWNVLENRRNQNPQGESGDGFRKISSLAQRGVMAFGERAVLFEKGKSLWRLGHGNPFPYELLTDAWASVPQLLTTAMSLFEKMVKFEKFVFVPSAANRARITIGNALFPGEYIIMGTLKKGMEEIIENGHASRRTKDLQKEFTSAYGNDIIWGLYRASDAAPAYEFYAHRNHVRIAALIAMADSLLQELRGFPMLIDVADRLCNATFKPETFYSTIHQAYAQAGYPFQFLSERETRQR